MSKRARLLAVPAYLVLCLLLGGSSQGLWSNALLQLLGVAMLAWTAWSPERRPLGPGGRMLLILCPAMLLLVVLQLVPLPPGLWSALPGREAVAAGYRDLGMALPWLPLSMQPYVTLETAYALVPPIAVFCVMAALGAYRESWVAGAVLLGALGNVLLGAYQFTGTNGASWTYFYRYTNTGAVGFFANRNHMATLLVVALPFAAALIASRPQRVHGGRGFALAAAGGAALVLVLVGLLLNSSLAAIALAAPVLALSGLILPAGWRWRRVLLPLALIALVGSVAALASSSVRTQIAGSSDLGSLHSRQQMWTATADAIGRTFPVGTGVGTFARVYASREDPAATDVTYVNHAHNDYLELVLETGLPGVVLVLLFLGWWFVQAASVWRAPLVTEFAKAATIASAAVLIHSIVDYPLRTAAVAAVFAACLAMMAQQPRDRRGRPRHVKIA